MRSKICRQYYPQFIGNIPGIDLWPIVFFVEITYHALRLNILIDDLNVKVEMIYLRDFIYLFWWLDSYIREMKFET